MDLLDSWFDHHLLFLCSHLSVDPADLQLVAVTVKRQLLDAEPSTGGTRGLFSASQRT